MLHAGTLGRRGGSWGSCGLVALVSALLPLAAGAQPCPLPRVTYDFSEETSIEQRERLHAGPRDLFVLLGHVRPTTSLTVSGTSAGRCVQRIDVRLHVRYRVHVAANFPRGSCRYRAVLAHEQRHIALSRRAYGSMDADVRGAIAREARDGAARGGWQGPVLRLVERLLRDGLARQDARHRRFDRAELGAFPDAVQACEFGRRRRRRR